MQPRSELDASPAAPVTTLLASLGLASFDSPFHRSSLSIQLTYSSICISIYHRQNEARLRCSRVDIWCFIGGAKLSGNWHQLKQKIQPSSRNKPELSAPSSFILQTNIFKCLDQIIAIDSISCSGSDKFLLAQKPLVYLSGCQKNIPSTR